MPLMKKKRNTFADILGKPITENNTLVSICYWIRENISIFNFEDIGLQCGGTRFRKSVSYVKCGRADEFDTGTNATKRC